MKKLIKDNYCILIGLVIGALLSATVVYATGSFGSNNVYYKNNRSSLSSNNVQGAIDELASKIEEPTECPEGRVCIQGKTTLALGDYVSMTPTLTSATTNTAKTGYTSSQTFNPSELNLWRVISINDDGTVDIISEYVSSTRIYFKGKTGYLNFVGYLNELASKYENSSYTKSSRHFGYNGQTEYITDTSKLTDTSPWSCDTGGSCNPVESQGGGDELYVNDYNLVKNVLGTRVAATSDSGSGNYYWMASRKYFYWGDDYKLIVRCVDSAYGSADEAIVFISGRGSNGDYDSGYYLRPILTLKSGLKYSGVGTKNYPMVISDEWPY